MEFGPVPLAEAQGAILAHSLMLGVQRLRKGQVLTADDLARIAAEGHAEVTVARPGPDDVPEDAAAARLAAALAPDPGRAGLSPTAPFTGRVNLNATRAGLLRVDVAAVHGLNRIHPSITLATLPPLARVSPGLLAGTVKIISYAVPEAALVQAEAAARAAVSVHPVALRSAGLLLTEYPGMDPRLGVKGRRAMETRLRALGMTLAAVVTTPHETAVMAKALEGLAGDMLLILTGTATSDLHDTAPQAVRRAGGHVARFGMPVDPGNLLFLGSLGARAVLGLPGCARSPALNGADWVLERLACGLQVTDDDIAAMGVGGLLKEIPIRAQPRDRPPVLPET